MRGIETTVTQGLRDADAAVRGGAAPRGSEGPSGKVNAHVCGSGRPAPA